MCYQNWNHTLIGVWNLMMSQREWRWIFFWMKDPKFHWKCLTWAAGKIIQQVLIPWEHVQSMFAILEPFNNRSSKKAWNTSHQRTASLKQLESPLRNPRFQVQWPLLFQLPPTNFDASRLFCTKKPGKTTDPPFFSLFLVWKTTGRDGCGGFFVQHEHRHLLKIMA